MGMHTYVVAIKAPDETWSRMRDAWNACEAAGVEPPKDVLDFFNYDPPDPAGVVLNAAALGDAVRPWDEVDHQDGFVVEIARLPPDVTHVRFVNSY